MFTISSNNCTRRELNIKVDNAQDDRKVWRHGLNNYLHKPRMNHLHSSWIKKGLRQFVYLSNVDQKIIFDKPP